MGDMTSLMSRASPTKSNGWVVKDRSSLRGEVLSGAAVRCRCVCTVGRMAQVASDALPEDPDGASVATSTEPGYSHQGARRPRTQLRAPFLYR